MLNWFKKLFGKKEKPLDLKSEKNDDNNKEEIIEKKENTNEDMICYHCKNELHGIESAKLNNKHYVICEKCSAVNRVENNKAYSTEKYTPGEMTEAFILFRKVGQAPSYYSISGTDKIPLPSLKKQNLMKNR